MNHRIIKMEIHRKTMKMEMLPVQTFLERMAAEVIIPEKAGEMAEVIILEMAVVIIPQNIGNLYRLFSRQLSDAS